MSTLRGRLAWRKYTKALEASDMESAVAEPVQLPDVGKISRDVFEHVIRPHLGKKRKSVLVGPQHGIDIGVVDIGHGQVMALTTDPFFIVPEYGWERAAWFAVHILASDVCTCGLTPTYFTVDLNLPRSITRDELEEMWLATSRACEEIGLAVVAGHTARYDGTGYPMVGGATAIAIGEKDRFMTPAMARVGDTVIVTKGAAIEATGLFGVTFPDRISSNLGIETSKAAQDLFFQMSVVTDARTAVQVGVHEEGVTAMHDATECGVWADCTRWRMRLESAWSSTRTRSSSGLKFVPSVITLAWTLTLPLVKAPC